MIDHAHLMAAKLEEMIAIESGNVSGRASITNEARFSNASALAISGAMTARRSARVRQPAWFLCPRAMATWAKNRVSIRPMIHTKSITWAAT
jgi:hypothetical protein